MVDITKIDAFVQNSPHPTWLATSRGECLYANPALERLTGLKSDQINQVDWRSFVLEEDRAAATASWQRSLASRTPCCTRVRMRGYDGVSTTVELTAFGHKVGQGTEVWLFSGLPVDVPTQQHPPFEADLQATLNVIPAYAWYALPSGGLTFVNERTADYLGLPKDHPLRFGIDTGAEWDSHIPLLHPDDHEESRKMWSRCLRTGSAGEVSFRVRDAKGGYRWFLGRAEPRRASDGTLLYWIGVNLEIDDAKRAEQALQLMSRDLQESNAKLEEAQRITHVGYWEWDVLTGRVNWSDEAYRIFGLRPQEPPMDLDTVREKIESEDWQRGIEKALGGARFNAECRVFRPTGEVRIAHFQGDVKRDASGRPYRMFGTVQDITDRKHAEEKLHQSQFYLAEGQRLAHMGSWAFNPSGFFDHWSHELFQIYGLDPEKEAPSLQEYLAYVHPQDREFMASLIQRMLADASGCDVTKRILRPNGELRYIRCVGTPVVENGTLQRIVGTAIDVTEHELLTQELRRREAYLAEAQRLSHTGSFGWKPDSGEIVWSEETYRIFEYDSTLKPTVDSMVQRVHPNDRALVQQVIDRASQTGTDFEHEYRLLMADGRVKHLHAIAHAVQGASGNCEFVGAVTDITERKTTEDKIRRLVDANILGIFIWNLEGAIVGANEAFLRMLQHGRDDLLSGRVRWTDLTPTEWRERDERALAELKATGTAQPYEKEFFRKDGSRAPVLIGGALFQGGGNEGVAFVLDLSEQKRAEEALRQSENYLAEAQRITHTGSWVWQVAGRDALHLSDEWYRIYGFDPKQGMPKWEERLQRVHPDDRDAWQGTIERAIRERSDYEVQFRILLPDGTLKWVHTVAHRVLNAAGELDRFVGSSTDVTERKNAEEKIREREAELRQMLDLTPQLAAVFGPRRERLRANRILLDYLGLSNEEWLQRSDRNEDIHPDDRERLNNVFDRALSTGSAIEVEMRVRKGDGSYRWFLVRYNPLRDDKGQITRWYAAGTDIEERKRAEDKLRLENTALREEIDQTSMFEEIVGSSPALQTVLSRISKVAPSDSTVLITGETGTGKELVARAIHRRSRRSGRAFVSVNCAAIPRDLIASELFGHEKGAFTGAMQRRVGRFEMADGGTIFLDEIGELSPDTQVALLRVLQEREFERVGGGQAIRVDVRIIAATNRDLKAAIANGTFRQDLFYRLNVFPIEVPPLRERKDDILLLVEYYVQRYATKAGKTIRSIEKKTLDALQSYDWPGNIRELQNIIERSVILGSGNVVSVDEAWLSKETSRSVSRVEASAAFEGEAESRSERAIIEAALADTRGRVSGPSGAAAKLGIPPSTLDHRIKALKINKRQFKFRQGATVH